MSNPSLNTMNIVKLTEIRFETCGTISFLKDVHVYQSQHRSLNLNALKCTLTITINNFSLDQIVANSQMDIFN